MSDHPLDSSINQWREKYLNALDAQEAHERENRRRQDLLRRALVRINSSVEGQDEALDQALMRLSEELRNGAEDLNPALTHVDQVLEDYDQRRRQAHRECAAAIVQTLAPLRELSLSRRLNSEIRHYLSQLPERLQKPRLYPALLEQLAEIQRKALDQVKSPPRGFWQKLTVKTASTTDPIDNVEEGKAFSFPTGEQGNKAGADSNISEAVADMHQPVAEVHALAQKIARLLSEWIDQMDVPDNLQSRMNDIQLQLSEGITSSDDLFALLETVRNVMVEAYIGSNTAFASYLNAVNGELSEIYAVLGGAADQQARQVRSAQALQNSVLKQMEDLESDTASATDLDGLKNQVRSQLGNIRTALDQFRQSEQDHEQFSLQLQELAEKVKIMEEEAQKNRATLEKQRHKALHDPLTELPNREAYNERMHGEFQRWQRYRHPLSIAICDIDFFKKINDSFGHQAGDRVLKVISRSIAKRLREVDFFGRYGGEEFVVILPETEVDKAHKLLEKIRLGIASTGFNYKKEPLVITLSFGITQLRPGDTIEIAFARADKALYAAKAAGRNRCEIA